MLNLSIGEMFVKVTKKIWLLLSTLAILILVTNCSSAEGTGSPNSAINESEILAAITAELPNCKFEELVVQSNEFLKYGVDDDEIAKSWMTFLINDIEFVPQTDAAGNKLTDKPSAGVKFVGAGDSEKYSVCNTKGRALETVSDKQGFGGEVGLEEATGSTFCWIPGRAPTSDEKKIFAKCEARLESNSRAGFWVGVHSFSSREQAEQVVVPLLERQVKYGGYSAYPMLFVGNSVIFANGVFDDVNQATVDEFDLAWGRIAEVLGATQASELVEDYPASFDRGNWVDFLQHHGGEGSRSDLNQAYEKLARYLTCNGNLRITELSFAVGECGKLSVEVFQSDLATGECNFLGYWSDSNGNEKIGVFEYCNTFTEGSIAEGSTYSLKARVSGTTSYQTKLGYQNQVLSFAVIGDY